MSEIHYFQRYNAKENWVTNSTLLLLSQLYNYNRLKFGTVLNSILTDGNISLNIGVSFNQQRPGKDSVVDGVISQNSFEVLIETKLYDNFTVNQLQRHLNAFSQKDSQKILLALSKHKVELKIRSEIIRTLKKDKYKEIKFASTTYEDIIQIISDNLSTYDVEMNEILNDYILLCTEQNLTNIDNHTLLAFTVGHSLDENKKYRLYYDPADRHHSRPFKYIGLYDNKTIVAVGELKKTISCNYKDGKLVGNNEDNVDTLTKEEYARIKASIENTTYYNLKNGQKFFLVDDFYKTHFVKTSFSSLRAKRYFNLKDINGYKEGMDAKQIASLLNGKTWE